MGFVWDLNLMQEAQSSYIDTCERARARASEREREREGEGERRTEGELLVRLRPCTWTCDARSMHHGDLGSARCSLILRSIRWSFVWRARFGLRLSSRVESRHESTWDLGHDSDTRQESQAQRGEDTQNTSRARVTESQTETIVHTAESTHGETDGASVVISLAWSSRHVTQRQTSDESRDER